MPAAVLGPAGNWDIMLFPGLIGAFYYALGVGSIEPVLDVSPAMTAGHLILAAGYTQPTVDSAAIARKAGIHVMQVEEEPLLAGVLVVHGTPTWSPA